MVQHSSLFTGEKLYFDSPFWMSRTSLFASDMRATLSSVIIRKLSKLFIDDSCWMDCATNRRLRALSVSGHLLDGFSMLAPPREKCENLTA
ncbi:hypothetical protein D3C72_1217770 [compost metagenome]